MRAVEILCAKLDENRVKIENVLFFNFIPNRKDKFFTIPSVKFFFAH